MAFGIKGSKPSEQQSSRRGNPVNVQMHVASVFKRGCRRISMGDVLVDVFSEMHCPVALTSPELEADEKGTVPPSFQSGPFASASNACGDRQTARLSINLDVGNPAHVSLQDEPSKGPDLDILDLVTVIEMMMMMVIVMVMVVIVMVMVVLVLLLVWWL